jgi:hypothetical protein
VKIKKLPPTKHVASIADIKYIKDLPEEFIPYAVFKARMEGRTLNGDERVAILNVATTTAYIALFLDKGKTIEDVEKEVKDSSAILNCDSKKILKELLEV